jgi:hypothetical protein
MSVFTRVGPYLLPIGGLLGLKEIFRAEAEQYWTTYTGTSLLDAGDNAGDAFRHAYTAARFAQYFGELTPNVLGLLNELRDKVLDPPGMYSPKGADMDLYNNFIGSQIGADYSFFDRDASWKIADDVFSAIQDGRLITDKEDPRINENWWEDIDIAGYWYDQFTSWSDDLYNWIEDILDSPAWTELGKDILNWTINLSRTLNDLYLQARNWIQPVDPLALDLDGDGIETTGIDGYAGTVLFDHDADGIRTGTGWLKGDDAFLVLDRNGNGKIDSGRELFGVDTVRSDGRKATDGLDALADLDSNNDGVFDASDAQFADVRLWRDLNQDGVSQANELTTLAENGIVSIQPGRRRRAGQSGQWQQPGLHRLRAC